MGLAAAVVVCLWMAGAANAVLPVTDTFTRGDGTALGTTEAGGVSYEEFNVSGGWLVPDDVARVESGRIRFAGGPHYGNPTDPAEARLSALGFDLDVTAEVRFLADGYDPGAVANATLFTFRQGMDPSLQSVFTKGSVHLIILPNGTYIIEVVTVSGNLVFGPSPTILLPANRVPIGPAFLLADTNGNGILENSEPFTLRAKIVGNAFCWFMNGVRIGLPVILPAEAITGVNPAAASNFIFGRTRALGVLGEIEVAYDNLSIAAAQGGCNQAPTAAAGPHQTVNEGVEVTLAGAGSDPDADPLTFAWTQVSGVDVALSDPAAPAPTFTAPLLATNGANEVLTFQLLVNDGFTDSLPATVNVTVKNVNTPPVAEATGPASVQEGATVQLSGHTSYDPDSDPLTFQWTPPVGVTLDLTDPVRPRFVAPAVGAAGATLTFELRVDDGFGSSATDTLDVAVSNLNQAPTADAGGPQTVSEGGPVALSGLLSSDPDLEPLTYQWTQAPGGPVVALVGVDTGTPSFTAPAVAATTVLTFELVVSDGIDVSAPAQTTVTVVSTNNPVACGSAFPSTGLLWPPNHALVPVTIAGVTDPDNDQVTITVAAVTQDEPVMASPDDPAPDAVLQGSQALVRAQRLGSGNGRVYEVRFTADDERGGSCEGSVKVGVPKSMKPGGAPVDDGQVYVSTQP